MSDSVWYYARGEQEKGPITTVQIKALAAAGKLHKEDFVWKEGMENWVPAGEVPGLFAAKTVPDSNSDAGLPAKQDQPRPHPLPRPSGPTGIDAQTRAISRLVFAVGLLTALLSRGCDTLGDRNVARRQAIAEIARKDFQDTWDQKRQTLEAERERLQAKPDRSTVDNSRLRELGGAIGKLDGDRTEAQRDLEIGTWLSYDNASTKAAANDRIWGYWRQATLLLATMLLTFGVLGVAYSSDGAERWISFVLLVVLVYSLYASNSVWSRVFS